MVKLQVKVKSARATYWYAMRIGEIFDVYRWSDNFVVAEDYDLNVKVWRHFDPADVEIVTE